MSLSQQQKSNGTSATNGSGKPSNGKSSGKRRRGRPPRTTVPKGPALGHEPLTASDEQVMQRFGDERRGFEPPTNAGSAQGPRAELAAMVTVIALLEPFDEDARARLLSWVAESLGIDVE